ncbi:MAG: dynamin family protein [Actinomycetota bacterium]|nr:dynamin family protein [Actinomycetota bacterium]
MTDRFDDNDDNDDDDGIDVADDDTAGADADADADAGAAAAGEGEGEGEPAAGTPRRATRDPLAVQVLRLGNRVHASLGKWGRDDLGSRITAEADQWNRQQLVVVACGDIKRGKSSLLNAILDRGSLLPVDADVATSVHLVMRYGPDFGIVVTRIGPDGEPAQEHAGIDDLIDVASMRGDPARREGVTSVEIVIDHPVLERGIVLIDTPGVGGMGRGHRDLALAALGQADALLFTVSAEEPVARTELEFLVEASERTEQVVLVVTKSDSNSEAVNGAMITELRSKLRTFTDTMRQRALEGGVDSDVPVRLEHLHDAPVVLTSSFLADQARVRREAGREEQAQRLLERSGIEELRLLLQRSADNRELIRVANLLALVRVLLADVEREVDARLRAANGDGKVAEELAQRQLQLEEFGSKQARWRTTLGNSIIRLQTSSSRMVTRELNRVKEHYRDVIDATEDGTTLVASLPGELEQSLHGAWNELVKAINDDFGSKLGELLAEFGTDGMDAVLGEFEMPEGLRELSASRASNTGGSSLLDDGLPMAMQTFTFANIANAAAGALGMATGGLGLIAYGVGAAIAYPIGKLRRNAREKHKIKGELQRYVADLLFGQEGVSREFSTELSLRILDLREEVERFVEQQLMDRRKQLEREHRELQQLLRAEAGKRNEAQAAAKVRLAEIGKLRAEVEPLQKAVTQRLTHSADAR